MSTRKRRAHPPTSAPAAPTSMAVRPLFLLLRSTMPAMAMAKGSARPHAPTRSQQPSRSCRRCTRCRGQVAPLHGRQKRGEHDHFQHHQNHYRSFKQTMRLVGKHRPLGRHRHDLHQRCTRVQCRNGEQAGQKQRVPQRHARNGHEQNAGVHGHAQAQGDTHDGKHAAHAIPRLGIALPFLGNGLHPLLGRQHGHEAEHDHRREHHPRTERHPRRPVAEALPQ